MSYFGGYFDFDCKVLVQCLPMPLECRGLHQRGQLRSVLSPLASSEGPYSPCITFRAPEIVWSIVVYSPPPSTVFANLVQNKAEKNRPFPLRESDFHQGDSLNFVLSLSCYAGVCYCIHASRF